LRTPALIARLLGGCHKTGIFQMLCKTASGKMLVAFQQSVDDADMLQ
jgi:hypothetical protein